MEVFGDHRSHNHTCFGKENKCFNIACVLILLHMCTCLYGGQRGRYLRMVLTQQLMFTAGTCYRHCCWNGETAKCCWCVPCSQDTKEQQAKHGGSPGESQSWMLKWGVEVNQSYTYLLIWLHSQIGSDMCKWVFVGTFLL